MPFADDVRKYTFPSFTNLVSKKGERITKHPYLPTDAQLEAMDNFVDAMDLMHAGDKDDTGSANCIFTYANYVLICFTLANANNGLTLACPITPLSTG